jgi:hypothetical protein
MQKSILDVLRKQETLTANKFERVNLGNEKKQTTKQQLKDAKIALLKKDYDHGDIDVMDYLMKLNEFITIDTYTHIHYIHYFFF